MAEGKKTKAPPPFPDDGNSRDRILDAALSEFTEHGLEGGRVARIAERAGVNKAMIYYYYTNKQTLYEEGLRHAMSGLIDAIRTDLDTDADFESVLRGVANEYQTIFVKRPEMSRLLLRELANPDSPAIRKIADTVRESGVPAQFQRLIREGQESGNLRRTDVIHTVVSFITLRLGYFLMSPLINRIAGINDEARFQSERTDAILDLFLRGVKAR